MLSEFKKRISQAGSSHSKAKLNLTSMDLNDRQVSRNFFKLTLKVYCSSHRVVLFRIFVVQLTILVEELAHTPVLAKLELNGNNISTAVSALFLFTFLRFIRFRDLELGFKFNAVRIINRVHLYCAI